MVIYLKSHNIDGLVQEICKSSALAMELRLFKFCTNPSILPAVGLVKYEFLANKCLFY